MGSRADEQKVKGLAFEECADFFRELNGHRNRCVAREEACVFASEEDLPRCAYFEKGVLPLNPELQAVYLASRKAAAQGHVLTALQAEIARESVRGPQPRVRCARCGLVFAASSNRQQLCPDCAKVARKERQRECTRRRRQKRSGDMSVAI